MKILISEDQAKYIFGQKYICPKCKHSWDIKKKDKDPKLCHWCGWDDDVENYDDEKLLKFWKKESKKDSNNLQWIEETKNWNVSQKKIFNESVILNEVKKLLNESTLSEPPIWQLMQELFEGILIKGEKEALTTEEKEFIENVFKNSDQEGKPLKQFVENENKLTSEAFQFFKNNLETFSQQNFLKKVFPTMDFGIPKINYNSATSAYDAFRKTLIQTADCDYCMEVKKILDNHKNWDVLELQRQKNLWEITKNARKQTNLSKNSLEMAEKLEKEVDDLFSSTEKNLTFSDFSTTIKNANPIETTKKVKVSEKIQNKGSKLSDAVRKVIQTDTPTRKYETSTLKETFEGADKSIFDLNRAGKDGFDEDGLNIEFKNWLNEQKPKFLENLKKGKYGNVYEINPDGSKTWSQLNKLDTNYSDKEFLFFEWLSQIKGKNIEQLSDEEIDSLLDGFIDDCNNNTKTVSDLIDSDPKKFVENISKNSDEGTQIEKNFDSRLDNIFFGSKNVFDGVEGNALDKAGIDKIRKLPNGDFVAFQFKKGYRITEVPLSNLTGKPGYSVFVKSSINMKKGYVGVEDAMGNWILFPPQQLFCVDQVTKTLDGKNVYTFKPKTTKSGVNVKGYRSGPRKVHFIDVTDQPGDEVFVGFNKEVDPSEIKVDFDITDLNIE